MMCAVYFLFSCLLVVLFFSINFKLKLSVAPLEAGDTVYSDRPYVLEGARFLLDGAYLVTIERHQRAPIFLQTDKASVVYRLLSDVNPNTEFSDWSSETDELLVSGSKYEGNLNHLTFAISKEFAAGSIRLEPGGPRLAAPIIVKTKGTLEAHTVRPFNKLIGKPYRNKKKIVGAGAFLLLSAAFCFI